LHFLIKTEAGYGPKCIERERSNCIACGTCKRITRNFFHL